jgi:hypothetical protein
MPVVEVGQPLQQQHRGAVGHLQDRRAVGVGGDGLDGQIRGAEPTTGDLFDSAKTSLTSSECSCTPLPTLGAR